MDQSEPTKYRFAEIACSNCRKSLGAVVEKNLDPSIKTRLIINCPFCGDKSFMKEIVGKFSFGAIDGLIMTGANEVEGIYTINLKEVK